MESTRRSAIKAWSATPVEEVTKASVRRERMGHIDLAAPVSTSVLQRNSKPYGTDS